MRVSVVRGPSPAGPFELREGQNHAGRAPECEIFLPSKRVSRKHAIFVVRGNEVEVQDLGSHNGILADDGRRVSSMQMEPGDRVQVGDYLLLLDGPAAEEELDLEEDDLLLDDDTAESDGPLGDAPIPPPPSLPFAPRAGAGFGAPIPATGRAPAPPPAVAQPAPGAPAPLPVAPAAPRPAKGAAAAAKPTPAAQKAAAPPAAPQKAAKPAPAAPAIPAPPPVVATPKPAAKPPPQKGPGLPPGPKPVEARPGVPASPPPPSVPRPAARTEPVPPPPQLPFPPAGGFGAPRGFGAPAEPRPAPPDPSRSILADADELLPLDDSPPPPWNPGARGPNDPETSSSIRPAPPMSDVTVSEPAPPRPPPMAAPAPAAPLPFGPPAGGFAARPEPPAPRPPDPPPPAPPRALAPSPRPADATAPAPPPPRALPVPDAGPVTRGGGVAWLAQAVLLVFVVVGILLCAPMGGSLALVRSRSASVEEVSLLRGAALAESLANRNAQPLAEGRGLALDTAFVLERAGVRTALVADKTGTVMAPAEKLRTSVVALPGYVQSSSTGDIATNPLPDGLFQIVAPIRGQAGGTGPRQIVGYALIEYDPTAVTAGLASPAVGGVAALFVACVVAGLLAGGAWWLVLRPIAALREETELALLGDHHDVVSPVRLPQMEQLAHSINRLVARARSAGGGRAR